MNSPTKLFFANFIPMIQGITFIDKFVPAPQALFAHLQHTVQWDERMIARKTASYGKAYNYSQMEYPFQNIADPEKTESYDLPSGSLIYMTQEVQDLWQHAIPKTDTLNGRMSLTFLQSK